MNLETTKSNISISDPADRFDVSYVFANNYAALGQNENALVEMSNLARQIAPGVHCRGALVHPVEIAELVSLLKGSKVRAEVVIDFPDGLGGVKTKDVQAKVAARAGAVGGDMVINIHKVQARDKKGILEECRAVKDSLGEVKAIAQIPYLWQYDKESIPWLLELLCQGGIYCVKDWTTRNNFLLPEKDILDDSLETRMRYVEFMADYITSHSLPLCIKVAGRVKPDNIKSFINAGALLIGTSYRKAPLLRNALLK